jgi:hypothetical protein
MKNLALILMFFCICSCSDKKSDNVKVSKDKSGNTIYEVEIAGGESIGIAPKNGRSISLMVVDQLGTFRVGQVWTYKNRVGEQNSRVTILRLEKSSNLGGIIHVSLKGLKINNPTAPAGITQEASHLPFSEEAIRKSVIELQSSTDVGSEYIEGYKTWRSAFQKGKAGIFATSLAAGVQFLEDTFRKANTQQKSAGNAPSSPPTP